MALTALGVLLLVGLREVASALRELGQSVQGFWTGQPGDTEFIDLEELMAQRNLEMSQPGDGLYSDLILESEFDG